MMKLITRFYEGVRTRLRRFPFAFRILDFYKRPVKYMIAGGTAGLTDLFLLFILTDVVGVHYLLSSVLAFAVAFWLSFILQKFWTFRDDSMDKVAGQAGLYFLMQTVALGVNTLLMYTLVTILGLWYLIAQIVASLTIALVTYSLNKIYIFKKALKTKKNTKILLATPLFPPDPGGPALHASEYERRLEKDGLKVRTLVFSNLIHYPFGLRHFLYSIQLFALSFGVDVVYALDATSAGWPAFIVAKTLRKPLLYRIGGDVLWERVAESGETKKSMCAFYASGDHQKKMLFYAVRFSLKRADHIIVPAGILKKLYIEEYGIEESRISTISNPLPEKNDVGFVKPKQTILFASRLVAYKNLDKLIKALEIVRKDRIELSLVIAGDGPEISSLRDLISHEWVEDYIDIKGRISEEEILRETQAALLLVAPAATEFSPNFVLRGIAYQKPFLISREHGLPFKVPEEYLIDPADPESVAEKINQILSENGYMEAKAWVSSIDYSQTWDDVTPYILPLILKDDLLRIAST